MYLAVQLVLHIGVHTSHIHDILFHVQVSFFVDAAAVVRRFKFPYDFCFILFFRLSFFSCSICFFFLVFIIILRPLQAPLTYIHTYDKLCSM